MSPSALAGQAPTQDRQSVQAQAEANAETAHGDTPKKDEHADISVRDIAAGWVYDARRWFSRALPCS